MKSLKWILENFGTIIVFQAVNYLYGFKTAVVASLIFAAIEFIVLKLKKRPITPFIVFSFALMFAFGAIDLYLDKSIFFKYESSILSLIMAGYFGISLLKDKSILEEFAEQQDRVTTERTEDKTFFFRLVTAFWTLYFITKGAVYIWINTNNPDEISFLYRAIFGTASFYILLALTLGLSKQLWNLLLKNNLMPSQRAK
jgi:intracellular septation protein A